VRRVVSNTGPILRLSEIDALDLLQEVGAVHIPPAVQEELQRALAEWSSRRPEWIQVIDVDSAHMVELQPWMDTEAIHIGEAAALALARQIQADWFLTDDAAARLVGRTMNLEVHGTIGILLWAAGARRLEAREAEGFLDRLSRSSLWMSPRVLAQARSALRVICP